ncbi:hypothetical protein SAMN04489860_0779 [Paraoerskovia marina]|uniref:Uncharacterized protein n=1 Tax=Paraoerskovia marina TaxID=545619 RepID=A0A1H1PDZ8_9CELL|nr:hypothetical protein SAMN04489860_0779 [Paraoerskovia marina]
MPSPSVRPDRPGPLGVWLSAVFKAWQITEVELEAFRRGPSFRGSSVSEAARAVTRSARAEHERHGFGFWEFVLAESRNTDAETQRALIFNALGHSAAESVTIRTTPGTLEFCFDRAVFEELPERSVVSLCSRVSSPIGIQHLPMLDFGVGPGNGGLRAAIDAATQLGMRGAIYASGRSMHMFGDTFIAEREMRHLLARAQLLSPIVDARWASHQLIDDNCRLRISTDVSRHREAHEPLAYLP